MCPRERGKTGTGDLTCGRLVSHPITMTRSCDQNRLHDAVQGSSQRQVWQKDTAVVRSMKQGHLELEGQEHYLPFGRGGVGAVCTEAGP